MIFPDHPTDINDLIRILYNAVILETRSQYMMITKPCLGRILRIRNLSNAEAYVRWSVKTSTPSYKLSAFKKNLFKSRVTVDEEARTDLLERFQKEYNCLPSEACILQLRDSLLAVVMPYSEAVAAVREENQCSI